MGRQAYSASRPVKVLSILVVDRGEPAKSIKLALSTSGMTAWSAESADVALDSVRNFDPDVILVNGDLPDLDAQALLASIRSEKVTLSEIPAVLFTVKHMEAAGPLNWAETGFDAVLPVPLHLRALPQIIERVAMRRKSVRRSKVVNVHVTPNGELASQSGSLYRAVKT
jgi:DNA-binding response OmpR family regulator